MDEITEPTPVEPAKPRKRGTKTTTAVESIPDLSAEATPAEGANQTARVTWARVAGAHIYWVFVCGIKRYEVQDTGVSISIPVPFGAPVIVRARSSDNRLLATFTGVVVVADPGTYVLQPAT